MKSIRKRLFIALISAFVLVWVATVTYTWLVTEHEIEEVFDAQLAQATNVLLGLARDNYTLENSNTDAIDLVHDYENKLAFQVWRGDKLLFRSANAPLISMTKQFGFSDQDVDGQTWRLLSRSDQESNLLIIAGEEYAVRQELIAKITLNQFWPIFIALPILSLLIVFSVNKGLQPLQKLTNEISKRSADQLTSVTMDHVPREASLIVAEINKLLKKLRRAMHSERQFTSDASHELRTPLAALKAQAQVAQQAKDSDIRDHALKMVVSGVDRSSNLVEQLLTLARLDPEALHGEFKILNINKIIEQSMAQLAHVALEKKIDLSLESAENISLNGIDTLFEILIANLLKNAFIYTPEGGEVHVSITNADKLITLSVEDSGSGIPKELRNRVFDRFYRIPGSKQIGSGLGLSIVKRIVDIHSGEVVVADSSYGGARIVVTLPNV